MTDQEVEKSKVVANEVMGAKSENSEFIASVTTDNQPDIMDQKIQYNRIGTGNLETHGATNKRRSQTSGRKVAQTAL